MKNIYLLALLPLGLITTGASGSPHAFVGNFKIEAPIGSKLTVDYPDGFGSMKLSAGQKVYADMLGGAYLANYDPPSADTFQTNVLNSNFSFNNSVVNAGTFKFPMYVYKGGKTSRTVDFQPALLKTSFTDIRLSGKTAVLTFDVPSENREGGKSLVIANLATNGVAVYLSKNDDSTKKLYLYFKMLCAKHPTASPNTKGTSAACTSSEFKPYNSSAKQYSGIDKYKMSLPGITGNYYHNTISFVPYNVAGFSAPAGTYTGNLKVTFGVE